MAYNKIFFQSSTPGNVPGWGLFVEAANKKGIPVFAAVTDTTALLDDLAECEKIYGVGNRGNFIPTGYVPAETMMKIDPNWKRSYGSYHISTPPYRLRRDDGTPIDTREEAEPIYKAAAKLHVEVVERLIPENVNRDIVTISSWNETRGYVGWGENTSENWDSPVLGYEGYADIIGWMAFYVGMELIRRKEAGEAWFRWAAFGFASGNPEEGAWEAPGMLAFLTLASEHPDVLGLSLHEYSYSSDIWREFAYRRRIGRFERVGKVCDQYNLRRVWVELTEFGWNERTIPPKPVALAQLQEVAAYYARFPELIGAGLWTAANGWNPASDEVPKLADGIYDMTLKQTFGDGAADVPAPPVTSKRVITVNLIPQTATIEEAQHVLNQTYARRQTITFSDDDAGDLVGLGAEGSQVVKWFADIQGDEIAPNGDSWLGTVFEAPVGTAVERRMGILPPGKWTVAVGYATKYTNSSTGKVSYHTGDDLNLNSPVWNADKDEPIYAAANGRCVFAGWLDVWGNVIVIQHRDVCTRYGHVEKMTIQVGQWVQRGERIAEVGQDALKGPDHLHYDIAPGDMLAQRPWDWPGVDLDRLKREYADPILYTFNNRPKLTEPVLWKAQVKPAALNLRLGPGTDYRVLLTARRGEVVNVLNDDGAWLRVSVRDTPGYMYTSYLDKVPDVTDLAPYFVPTNGSARSAAFELANNWGQGAEIVQLVRDGDVVTIQKNAQYEKRRLSDSRIYFFEDTSRGGGEFYRIESATGWLPRRMAVGDRYTRNETVTVFRKVDCQKVHGPYTSTSDILFEQRHDTWRSEAGVIVADVIQLAWIVNGAVDERYYYAAGHGLVGWEKIATGQKSWIKRYASQDELPPREALKC